MTVYLDSTIVIRQLVGTKTPWAGWGAWDAAYASALMRTECYRTANLLRLSGKLDDEQRARLGTWIERVCESVTIVPVTDGVLRRAADAFPTAVGALQAIHLATLLELGVVPIINENDTVITDEIKFGDNDTLGALVANLIEAEGLIILTDQSGLYTADPRKDPGATLIGEATAGDETLERMAGGAGSSIGKGGMITKVLAAKRAAKSGAHTAIASGREADVVIRLAAGAAVGTLLVSETPPLAARKQWLADHLQTAGRLVLDAGAVTALRAGKSLLPVGVVAAEGEFERGAAVACISPDGREIARGLSNYGGGEARLIARKSSQEIVGILGYVDEPELIHRDNLILIG